MKKIKINKKYGFSNIFFHSRFVYYKRSEGSTWEKESPTELGVFVDKQSPIDLLIVGKVDKNKLQNFLDTELQTESPIRFSVLSRDDFLYRIKCKDQFIKGILNDSDNIIAVNKLEKYLS